MTHGERWTFLKAQVLARFAVCAGEFALRTLEAHAKPDWKYIMQSRVRLSALRGATAHAWAEYRGRPCASTLCPQCIEADELLAFSEELTGVMRDAAKEQAS